jgi:hypothetical protein
VTIKCADTQLTVNEASIKIYLAGSSVRQGWRTSLLKRKAENPVAMLERSLSDLTARRAAVGVKLTDAAGALAVAVGERRRRRSSNRSNGKSVVVTPNDVP